MISHDDADRWTGLREETGPGCYCDSECGATRWLRLPPTANGNVRLCAPRGLQKFTSRNSTRVNDGSNILLMTTHQRITKHLGETKGTSKHVLIVCWYHCGLVWHRFIINIQSSWSFASPVKSSCLYRVQQESQLIINLDSVFQTNLLAYSYACLISPDNIYFERASRTLGQIKLHLE